MISSNSSIRKAKYGQYLWILWLVLGVFLVIAEIFTLGFVLLWFGIGAFAAAFAAIARSRVFVQFVYLRLCLSA